MKVRLILLALALVLSCSSKSRRSEAFTRAMAAYERALSESFSDPTHEAFDEVLVRLREVSEENRSEYGEAQRLIAEIEDARNAKQKRNEQIEERIRTDEQTPVKFKSNAPASASPHSESYRQKIQRKFDDKKYPE